MRYTVLWLASFGGVFIATGGWLAAAGLWFLAVVAWLLGVPLLAEANRRLLEVERVIEIAYDGPRGDEVYIDPFGPFGWMRDE